MISVRSNGLAREVVRLMYHQSVSDVLQLHMPKFDRLWQGDAYELPSYFNPTRETIAARIPDDSEDQANATALTAARSAASSCDRL
jgi:hypothetical protein